MLNFSFCNNSDIVTNRCKRVDGAKLVALSNGNYSLNGIKDCIVNYSSNVFIDKCSPLGIEGDYPSVWELGIYKVIGR